MTSSLLLAWSPFDPMHLLVIGIVALLLFGKRLPEVGRSLGRGIAEFKKGLRDVQEELNRDEKVDEPPPPKLRAPREPVDPVVQRRGEQPVGDSSATDGPADRP